MELTLTALSRESLRVTGALACESLAAGDGGAGARIAARDAGVDAGRLLNSLSGCGDWAGTRARCGGDENGWILVAHACTLLPS